MALFPNNVSVEGQTASGRKEREFLKCKTFSPFSKFFFYKFNRKKWSNSFRRGKQYTRVSVVRPAERGQHQGCPACPLRKCMEARHGQVLLGSLCLFLDFLMDRKVVERTILL